MSSLAAARADNFYYPPEFDPVKHKSLNKFNGQHPLRERAKKLDQGILVIRFEVPFHIWCDKCKEKVAKGERFNAEKKQVGNYYSTKIWEFSMRHHCGCTIVITTDPKNTEYIVTSGAQKKEEDYTAADAGVIELVQEDEREKIRTDAFYALESEKLGAETRRRERVGLSGLLEVSEERSDVYRLNQAARAALRTAKREAAALDRQREALGLPETVPLLPAATEDTEGAALAFYSSNAIANRSRSHSRKDILTQSIFSSSVKRSNDGGKGIGAALRSPVGVVKVKGSSVLDRAKSMAKRVQPNLGVKLQLASPARRV